MIKNILVPEKFGNYYVFPQHILSFDVGKSHVNAVLLLLKGTGITIEQTFDELIEPGNTQDYPSRATAAIKTIMGKVSVPVRVHCALSSSLVIFKELTLPFLTRDKIALTLPFEVEPLLPFALGEAVIDFMITQQNSELKQSTVLAAAVQKKHIEEHLALFEQAGVNPEVVTIDFFALYSIYQQIYAQRSLQNGCALVDIGTTTTRIGYIYQGRLKSVRTLATGITTLAKIVAQKTGSTPAQALDYCMRFGLEATEDTAHRTALTEAFKGFLHEVQFTLRNFVATTPDYEIKQVLLLGGGAHIKDLAPLFTTSLGLPTELFDLHAIGKIEHITLAPSLNLPCTQAIALGAGLPWPAHDDINFRKDDAAAASSSLLMHQLLTAAALMLAILLTLFGHTYWQARTIQAEINESRAEAVEEIKKEFPKLDSAKDEETEEVDLNEIVKSAKAEVDRRQEMWLSFSGQERSSFLKYLLELTKIDKQNLGLVVESLKITGRQGANAGTIILKARVRDFAALKTLEKLLNDSPLFEHVQPQDEPNFTMKIRVKNDGASV